MGISTLTQHVFMRIELLHVCNYIMFFARCVLWMIRVCYFWD